MTLAKVNLGHQPDPNVARLRRELMHTFDAVRACLRSDAESSLPTQAGDTVTLDAPASGIDATSMIQAAVTAVGQYGTVCLGAGTFGVSEAIEYPSDITIKGSGPQSTILDYTGSGYCFVSASPGVRTYNQRFEGFQISLYDSTSPDGGISMDSVSLAEVHNVVVQVEDVAGAGYAFHIEGGTSGFAVYNAFYHCRALSTDYGFYVDDVGSNDTLVFDCRSANCNRGVSVRNSNHTVMIHGRWESGVIGVFVNATTVNTCDATTMIANRFEGNSSANISYGATPANVRYPQRIANTHVTGTPSVGAPSFPTTLDVASDIALEISSAVQDGPFQLERTNNGGTNLPALYVRDTNSSTGTPNTVQAAAARHAGHVFSGGFYNAGVYSENWFVDADGNVTAVSHEVEDVHVTSSMEIDAGVLIQCGDGTATGNLGLDIRRGASNTIWLQMRTGSAATGLRWSEQFTTGDNVRGLMYASGAALGIAAYEKRYSATNGRGGLALNRLFRDLGTALVAGDFGITAGGVGAAVTVVSGSTDQSGQFELTVGVGVGATTTVTLTYTDGGYGVAPSVVHSVNGGTTVTTGSMTYVTCTPSATTCAWVIAGMLSGETIRIAWGHN